jgi:hypothetical protein
MAVTEQDRTDRGPGPAAAGYDSVSLRSADGTVTTWNRSQFEGLGLVDRVRLLAGGQLRFYRQGIEVSARSALSQD